MTHADEADFAPQVEAWLVDTFGDDAVESGKWLSRTTCYADFWVDTGVVILAIEVENDAGSIRDGVGQALEYAQNDPRAVPVVITPVGHADDDQADALRNVCPIIEYDPDGDGDD